MIDRIKNRLEELQNLVKGFLPEKAGKIKEEIKELYIEITNAMKTLSQAQEELRRIALEFKEKRSSEFEVRKFYSVVKSRRANELDIATLLDRAWNLIVIEDYDEAMQVIRKVLEIDPKNVKGLGFMGLSLMNKEDYDNAMLYFQQVLSLDPENPFALNNLGYICYKKGIWGEAIEHLVKAAKQTKDRAAMLYANYYLGLVYYEREMIPDAIKFFQASLNLGPNLQAAYYYLGLSQMKIYEFKSAVESFEKCIKIDAASRYGKLAAEEMNKIRPLTEPDRILSRPKEPDNP